MDLEARKYLFIRELFSIESESIIDALELVLKREKQALQKISVDHKKEIDNRLESYKDNPNEVLDWQDVRNDW